MEALRGRKYQLITIAAIAAVVTAAAVGTLMGSNATLQGYVPQHERARAQDVQVNQGTAIDAESFASQLPVVSIDTHGQDGPGDVLYVEGEPVLRDDDRTVLTTAPDGSADITADFRLYDGAEGDANRLSDAPSVESKTLVHYRGHRSREFPKRNYSIHLVDDAGLPRNEKLAGMASENAWVLNGPYLDKSLIRNYVSYTLGQHLRVLSPDVRFCELFMDGEYRGVFLLMESVKEGGNRVNLTEPTGRGDTTSYLLKMDRPDIDAASLEDFGACTEPKRSEFSVLYPSDEELTQGRMDWIAQDMNALEKALYSYDYDTSDYGYWTSLDVDSFVDYFVFNEFTMNYDAGTYSTYVYKDLRGKLTIGPLWDFNSAYDNYVDRAYDDCEGFAMVDRYFYYMLSKDEKFVEAVIDRYHELRQDLLADEYVCAYIDETVSFLGDAADRNWEAWGYTFDPTQVRVGGKLAPDERNPATYDEAVEQVKTFVQARGAWLDAHIEDLRQFSHESAVKMNNH